MRHNAYQKSAGTLSDLLAVSQYILPHRFPYLAGRYIHFYDLATGEQIKFKGDLQSSNYSQGLTFFTQDNNLFLVEPVNKFGNVLKYWITGLDNYQDLIRIYQINEQKREIEFINEFEIPGTMVEDLAFDGKYFHTTDEQDFSFYHG